MNSTKFLRFYLLLLLFISIIIPTPRKAKTQFCNTAIHFMRRDVGWYFLEAYSSAKCKKAIIGPGLSLPNYIDPPHLVKQGRTYCLLHIPLVKEF